MQGTAMETKNFVVFDTTAMSSSRLRWHRQLDRLWHAPGQLGKLAVYIVMATLLISDQTWNAWVLAARCWRR